MRMHFICDDPINAKLKSSGLFSKHFAILLRWVTQCKRTKKTAGKIYTYAAKWEQEMEKRRTIKPGSHFNRSLTHFIQSINCIPCSLTKCSLNSTLLLCFLLNCSSFFYFLIRFFFVLLLFLFCFTFHEHYARIVFWPLCYSRSLFLYNLEVLNHQIKTRKGFFNFHLNVLIIP